MILQESHNFQFLLVQAIKQSVVRPHVSLLCSTEPFRNMRHARSPTMARYLFECRLWLWLLIINACHATCSNFKWKRTTSAAVDIILACFVSVVLGFCSLNLQAAPMKRNVNSRQYRIQDQVMKLQIHDEIHDQVFSPRSNSEEGFSSAHHLQWRTNMWTTSENNKNMRVKIWV